MRSTDLLFYCSWVAQMRPLPRESLSPCMIARPDPHPMPKGQHFRIPEPLLRCLPDDLAVRVEEAQGRRVVIAKDQFGSVFPVTAGHD